MADENKNPLHNCPVDLRELTEEQFDACVVELAKSRSLSKLRREQNVIVFQQVAFGDKNRNAPRYSKEVEDRSYANLDIMWRMRTAAIDLKSFGKTDKDAGKGWFKKLT